MKAVYINIFIIVFLVLSCKTTTHKTKKGNISKNKIEKEVSLRRITNLISPKKIKTPEKIRNMIQANIISTEAIDYTGNGKLDFLCKTIEGEDGNKILKEYWISSNWEIDRIKKIEYEYDYKWFINLDSDSELEIIKAQGESEGINYGIYNLNFHSKNDDLLFYFNPIIESNKLYYWGYPWEIENLKIDNYKIKTSLKHKIERDGAIQEFENQILLPAIIFTGKSRKELEINDLKNIKFLSVKNIMSEVIIPI